MKSSRNGLVFLVSEAVRLIFQGRISELFAKVIFYFSVKKRDSFKVSLLEEKTFVRVWASPDNFILAKQIVDFFINAGISAEINKSSSGRPSLPDLEIVLTSKHLKLPITRGPRIVYQLEKITSSQPFTIDYIYYLKSAVAVLEHSESNIPKLISMGIEINNLFYVPLEGNDKTYEPVEFPASPDVDQPDFRSESAVMYSPENRFRFMLARALLGLGFADEKLLLANMDLSANRDDLTIVLSLPETTERRARAVESLPAKTIFFDGAKLSPGWVGSATSYKLLSTFLLNQGVSRVTICEDDVILPPSYDSDIRVVMDYLDSIEDTWDLFVGLTADFDYTTTITNVVEFKGRRFIHQNKFTSMVLNIYSRIGLEKISSWDAHNAKNGENTIDRFLNEGLSLNVISLDSNICGHDSKAVSTLWGAPNSDIYDSMILRSNYIRFGLMHEWLEK
jgi:hypothetical protein